MCSFFLNRNYPHDVVSRALAKVSVSRKSALVSNTHTTNNRILSTVIIFYRPLIGLTLAY